MLEGNSERLHNKFVYSLIDNISLGCIIEIDNENKTCRTNKNICLDFCLEDKNIGWTIDEVKIKKIKLIERNKKKQEMILSNFYHKLEGVNAFSMKTGENLGIIIKLDIKSNKKKYITNKNFYLNPYLENNNDYNKKGWTISQSYIDKNRINEYILKEKPSSIEVIKLKNTLNKPELKDFLEKYNSHSMTKQKYWIN